MAVMPKWSAFTHNGLLLCRLFIVLVWGCAELVGECIQGLVLLGNQWLLFVELGGFVNNALFHVPECVLVGKRPLRIFVCVLLFLLLCLWIRVSKRNPLIVCCVQAVQFYIRHMWALVCPCVSNIQYECKLFSAGVRKMWSWRGLLPALPNGAFHSPPFMWRYGDGEGGAGD